MWPRQASLLVSCRGLERCGLIMMMGMEMTAASAQVAAVGHAGPSQRCWDTSHLSVVGETVSTESARPGLESCHSLGP